MSEENKESESKGVTVKIDTKNVESLIERLKEKELENKQLHERLEGKTPTKEEFESEALMEEKIIKTIGKMKKEYEEEKLQEAEAEGSNVQFSGRGAGGSVGLREEDIERELGHKDSKTFENYSSLVSHLKSEILKGSETAKKQYSELVKKCLKGLQEKQLVLKENPEEPSFIQHVLSERNKRLRSSKTKESD